MRSAIAPTIGKTKTWAKTEKEITYGNKEPGLMLMPQRFIKPDASAALSAIEVKYGPKNKVMTVVEKAEFAQSYKYQLLRTELFVKYSVVAMA